MKETALTSNDFYILKNNRNDIYFSYIPLFFLVLLVTAGGFFYLYYHQPTTSKPGFSWQYFIPLVFLALATSVIALAMKRKTSLLRKDIVYGKKKIIKGVVRDKQDQSTLFAPMPTLMEDTEPSIRENVLQKQYILVIDDYQEEVDEETYQKFAIGEKVSIHMAPHSQVILDITR
jgi:hypothetical protein